MKARAEMPSAGSSTTCLALSLPRRTATWWSSSRSSTAQAIILGRQLGVDVFSFEGTIADGDAGYALMQAHAASPDPLPVDYFEHFSGEHEQVLEIIAAIRQADGRVFFANLPNHGRCPNWPAEAVLEGPAASTKDGLIPLAVPPLSAGLAGTLATRFQWVEATVEAALERSRDKFIQALVLDGAVSSLREASSLADDLLKAQAPYLDWI
jgi:alpha-galactosidase